MDEKKIKWYKIADGIDMIEWQRNNMSLAEAGGRKITLARINNEIFACAHTCPHAGGILADFLYKSTAPADTPCVVLWLRV